MAAEKRLSEIACKSAKAKDKLYYLSDGAGLRLRIKPDGSKTWIYRFRLNGKETSSGLGSYPKVSLQIARVKAGQAKLHVNTGMNPSTANRIAKAAQTIKGETTFGLVAKEWLQHNKAEWSTHHFERNEGLIRRYLLPDLARLPIDSIEEAYLFSIFKKMYDKGTKESARRTRAVAAQIFSYARATHQGTKNPARDMADNPYLKKPQVKHFKALPKSQVGELISSLNKTGPEQILDPKTICGIRMAIYTGLRDNSIRGAQWKEIDFDKAIWTVPASRMKSGREHKVPLPQQALEALLEIKPLTYRSETSYIFSSTGKTGYMAENTLRRALHNLGFKVTIHGMRSLITDVLNEQEFHPDAIERQLDHTEKNKVRKAYLRTDFMEKRFEMMQWFADWCDQNATGKEVAKNITTLKVA